MRKIQSLAFTALLCAIHILIIFASEYVPFLDLIMVFFLPIFSAILAIKCELKYSFILFVATLLIGILINPTAAPLYLLSPLVLGIGYGILVKYKVRSTTIIYLLTILSMGLLLLDIHILEGITGQDFVRILCDFFHIDSFYDNTKVYFIFLLFGFSQAFVTHFVLKYILKRMKIEVKKNEFPPVYLILIVLGFIIAAIAKRRNYIIIDTCTMCAVFFSIPLIVHGYRKNKAIVPLLIAQAVIFLVICIPVVRLLEEQVKYTIFTLILLPPLLYGTYRLFKEHSGDELITTF